MTTVAELIKQLQEYPDDMLVISSPDEEIAYGTEHDEEVSVQLVRIGRPPNRKYKMDYSIQYPDRYYFEALGYEDIKPAILII